MFRSWLEERRRREKGEGGGGGGGGGEKRGRETEEEEEAREREVVCAWAVREGGAARWVRVCEEEEEGWGVEAWRADEWVGR